MSQGYSISIEGIRAAELRLDRAARNLANGRTMAPSAQRAASSDLVRLHSADPAAATQSASAVDYAHEMVTIIEARTGFDANLKVVASQEQLDRSALDLLA